MPKAKAGHLPTEQGVEIMPTGLAPPRRKRAGWVRIPQILLTNYGFILSSGYAISSQETDYVAVSEAAGF
jgi:hypothetical protein